MHDDGCVHSCTRLGWIARTQSATGYRKLVLGKCNVYIILAGRQPFCADQQLFLCIAKFRLEKLVLIWLQAVFYSVGIYLVIALTHAGGTSFSLSEFVKCTLVFTMDRYWFVTCYILLYCIFPILNRVIHSMNQKQHLLCCCVLLILFSILPNIFYVEDFSGANDGYSLSWFCVLYIIAAYFRLYVPNRVKFQKWTFPAYAILALTICAERFAAYCLTPMIFGRVVLTSLFYPYNSIVSVLCAMALFQAFRGFEIKNKLIETGVRVLAPLTFAVYLIHEQDHCRPLLWQLLNPVVLAESPFMVAYVIGYAMAVFAACCLIEWQRLQLFKICRVNIAIKHICNLPQEHIQLWLNDAKKD